MALALSQGAAALPIPATLGIDFRDAAWALGDGLGEFTLGTITVDALPEEEWIVPWLPPLPAAELSHSVTDGFGVNTPLGESDEIDGTPRRESLVVSFAGGRSDITGAWISNLFADEEIELCFWGICVTLDTFDEFGAYEIDGGPTIEFHSDQSDGNLFLSFGGPTPVNSISFFVPSGDHSLVSDFSVVGFTTADNAPAPVPEPGALSLLGFGLLGLGIARLRRRAR